MEIFRRQTRIPAPAAEVFDWHARPGAIERLTPPWERIEISGRNGGIDKEGSRVVVKTRLGPFFMRWVAEHRGFEAGRQFRDLQIEGPFAHWEHTHSFEPDGPDACLLEDHIEYALPGGRLGRLLGGSMVRDRLARLFDYRHQTTASDLAAHRRSASTMRIGVSGASGLLGSALVPFLTTGGHEVQRIARRKDWDFDLDGLGGLDAVVHLAGENLAMGRWTAAKKERIRASRVEGTRRIAEHVAGLRRMPRALVVASAVGFYGDRGDELLEEESPGGEGFLAEVCRDWEAAPRPAEQAGVRVVH
ncbi:MAG: NAD-dependent epimerase/dehydratase family protein, partial [Planctomycetota bacterium]